MIFYMTKIKNRHKKCSKNKRLGILLRQMVSKPVTNPVFKDLVNDPVLR